ncbi:MAG: MFS transporter [Paracoccus sp. (in: a-proteobacteria)]
MFSQPQQPLPPKPGFPVRPLMALMVTQTLGWGCATSLIGVIAAPIRADLGMSDAVLYGGTSLMFLTGAAMAPVAGMLSDRIGGLRTLCLGSPLLGLALLALSVAQGPASYLAAWLIFGVSMHLALATAAYNGLASVSGQGAYRSIGLLTLATGLCSTIMWPLSEMMLQHMDWRELCRFYALLMLALATPLHIWLAVTASPDRNAARAPAPSPAHVPPEATKSAFRLMLMAQVLVTSLGTGIAILIIDILVALGTERSVAVIAGSLIGVAYLISRGAAVLIGDRIPRMALARIVFGLLPLTFLPLLVCVLLELPVPGWLAITFGLIYGMPAGLVGVLKPAMPWHIFGSAGYGRRLGRLAGPTDLATAASPALMAWLMGTSPKALVVVAIVMASLAFLCIIRLSRLAGEGRDHRHYESV